VGSVTLQSGGERRTAAPFATWFATWPDRRSPDHGNGSDRGSTATEYGILVGFVAVAIVVGVSAFGVQLAALVSSLASALTALLR
jgi:pilus assembly protein Flp/PilA